MRKTLIVLGCLSLSMAHAQQVEAVRGQVSEENLHSRMGVNTDKPVATLEVAKINNPAANQVEGFMLPHLTQAQRNNMKGEELVNGLQIFNTTKNCIDWWDGRNWQCTDGTLKDKHGEEAAYRETATYTETRNFFKSNCGDGQQPSGGVSFDGEGYGVGISSISLQEAKDKALANAKADYMKLGQEYANANGTCEATPTTPPTTPIIVGAGDRNFKIGNTKYWFSSIYDNNYFPWNINQVPATASWDNLSPVNPNGGGTDKVLDVQGVIPKLNAQKDNAIAIAIPIETAASTSFTLPSYTTYLDIPAEYTEDGKKGIVVFTWDPVQITRSTKFFKAHIYAKDADINLKKLDLAKGMGQDFMGLALGKFKYPKDASDNVPANWQGELELRLISGIPDRRFNQETTIALDTQRRHQFIYVPQMGPDRKMWLGNNLGADYANVQHEAFNPGQQAKTPTDHNAFGSLFQWGRVADGHELMTWTKGTGTGAGVPTYGNVAGYNWTSDQSSNLNVYNENCPEGWELTRGITLNVDVKTRIEGLLFPNLWVLNYQRNKTNGSQVYGGQRYSNSSGTHAWPISHVREGGGTPLSYYEVDSWTHEFTEAGIAVRNSSFYDHYNKSTGLPLKCVKL